MDAIYAGITVAILVVWYWLSLWEVPMTPRDIYGQWAHDVMYTAPENKAVALGKTRRAIRKVEVIFDRHGPNTDAGAEAVEVLQKLRAFERQLLLKE